MSWRDYADLLENRNTAPNSWHHAAECNPNNARDALMSAVQHEPGAAVDMILAFVANTDQLRDSVKFAIAHLEDTGLCCEEGDTALLDDLCSMLGLPHTVPESWHQTAEYNPTDAHDAFVSAVQHEPGVVVDKLLAFVANTDQLRETLVFAIEYIEDTGLQYDSGDIAALNHLRSALGLPPTDVRQDCFDD